MICERAAEKTTQLWICAEIRASKEQVRSEDCLFPVAGFLIAERQATVKDALHRAAALSLTVGWLCSAEICLRDGDKIILQSRSPLRKGRRGKRHTRKSVHLVTT